MMIINKSHPKNSWPLMLAIILFAACSSGPSHSDIEQAVSESLQKHVPMSLAQYLTGGQNAVVQKVRVLKIGKAQGRGGSKYWPVRIYARGACVKMFGGRQPFEGPAEYHVSKDPYGKWTASPLGF